MKIHFYVNTEKPEAQAARVSLSSLANVYSHKVVENGYDADIIISLGGDGTILRAVHEFPGVPILGFNLGGLGYLSSVEKKDFEKAFEMLTRGEFSVVPRMTLAASKNGSPRRLALNDIVLNREMSGHAAILDLEVDGRGVTRYLSDGLIIATPTGSTAYSLAAGGPILTADSKSFVVTPMNPHALSIRPIVFGDNSRFKITSLSRNGMVGRSCHGGVEDGDGKIGVYADGVRVFELGPNESLEIAKCNEGALMVDLSGYDPYDVMAKKLGFGGTAIK